MFNPITMNDIVKEAKRHCIPLSVAVEVTYTCNEQCIHCYLDSHAVRGMSLGEYEHLFDQLAEAGTLFVTLTGGEPFSRPDFIDILRAARKRRLSVSILTNGTLLTAAIVEELKSLHIYDIHISLYGSQPKTHDAITHLPGSFVRTTRSIRLLIEAGIPVKIKCPLMRQNIHEAHALKALARDLGARIFFNPLITARNSGDTTVWDCRLTPDQLAVVMRDPDLFEQEPVALHSTEELSCGAASIGTCDVVFTGGSVDPTGAVFPCNQLRINLGNVRAQPFGDIWKNSKNAHYLRSMSLHDLHQCGSCDLLQYCGRCPGLALLEDGDLLGCSSAAHQFAQSRRDLHIYPSQPHLFNPRGVIPNE